MRCILLKRASSGRRISWFKRLTIFSDILLLGRHFFALSMSKTGKRGMGIWAESAARPNAARERRNLSYLQRVSSADTILSFLSIMLISCFLSHVILCRRRLILIRGHSFSPVHTRTLVCTLTHTHTRMYVHASPFPHFWHSVISIPRLKKIHLRSLKDKFD